MKTKSSYKFFVLFLLLFGFCCIPGTLKLNKHSDLTQHIRIDNFLQKAFNLYNQDRLSEATKKLETAIQILPKEPTSSLLVCLHALLGFLQERNGDSEKANLTYSLVRDFFQKLRDNSRESEALAIKLIQFSGQLRVSDRLPFWERLRPIAKASHGKAGEGGALWQIGEAYILLNNYPKAYEIGIEALKLARDSENLALEVYVSLVISRSLIGLGRTHEAEVILQGALIKTKDIPLLKANTLLQLGLVTAMIGRKNQSIKYFQDAIAIARSLEAIDLEAKIEYVFAAAYIEFKKTNEAMEKAKKALSLFEKFNDTVNMANVEGMIALVYFQNNSFEEAKSHALRAAKLNRRIGNRIEEAKNLRIAGQSMAGLNKVDEAIDFLQKATNIFVEEKNLNESEVTYWWTIGYLRKLGRVDDIRHSLLTGLDANAKIFQDKKVEVKMRSELARVYRELGLLSEALNEYINVLTIYKELSNNKEQIQTCFEMASIFADLKDFENWTTAVAYAMQLGKNLNDVNVQLMILNHEAESYLKIGNIVEALLRYQEAIKLSQLIGKFAEEKQMEILGWFYLGIGEYAKALEYFEKGFILAKEIGEQSRMKSHLLGIGYTFYSMQQYENAFRVGLEALDIVRKLKSKPDEDGPMELISLALIGQGKYEAALQVEKERLELVQLSESPELIKNVNSRLGYIKLRMGKYAEAFNAYKLAIEWAEHIRSQIIGEKYKIRFLERALSPYEGIIEALYHLYIIDGKKNRIAEEALHFAGLSKARSWSEQISISRLRFIEDTIPQGIRIKEDAAINQFLKAKKAYTLASTRYLITDKDFQKAERAWERAKKKWIAFVEDLYRRYPEYVTLRYPLTRIRYPEDSFRKLAIRDGETLIVYKTCVDWTYAWVLKKNKGRNEILKFTRLPIKTNDIEKLVGKLLMPFLKVKYEQFNPKVSNELFLAILNPVIDGIDLSKRLVIVPDGILSLFPFEALVTEMAEGNKGQQTNRFLFDKFRISYYPSTAILTINRQAVPKTLPPKGTILAVGDPIYDKNDERLSPLQVSLLGENEQKKKVTTLNLRSKIREAAQTLGFTFDRLKHSGVEVQKISEIFRNMQGSPDVLIGFEASKERVKLKDLTQYQYLHFAVHGILSNEVPYLKEPALILAVNQESKEDEFLKLSEIYELKLNSDLVTLSACKSGLGLRISGEGVIGLSRAFMNAGARAVIASLWEVGDQSTALLMEEFYRLLANGVNKVEALSIAKQYLRIKGYENPFFWAPFILIGD